jgi:hypothetical protein
MDRKSGKLVARLATDNFTCPFFPGKKKQDYRYNEVTTRLWPVLSRSIMLMQQSHYHQTSRFTN